MKQTWKKIASLMMVVICAFAFAACGNKEESAFQTITDEMADNCIAVSQSAVQSLASFDDATIEAYKTNRDDFTRLAVIEWDEETANLGAFQSMGEPVADINREEGQITVKIPATFEKNAGEIEVVFNYSKDYDQMVPAYLLVSEEETFAGNMRGAGINTVMGVGTVFAVLVFLIFVISLFKYVNLIGAKKDEKPAPAPKVAPAPAPKAAPAAEENLVDDLELVAVISAAIAASENTSTDSFVVRSIKKVNRSKWQRA